MKRREEDQAWEILQRLDKTESVSMSIEDRSKASMEESNDCGKEKTPRRNENVIVDEDDIKSTFENIMNAVERIRQGIKEERGKEKRGSLMMTDVANPQFQNIIKLRKEIEKLVLQQLKNDEVSQTVFISMIANEMKRSKLIEWFDETIDQFPIKIIREILLLIDLLKLGKEEIQFNENIMKQRCLKYKKSFIARLLFIQNEYNASTIRDIIQFTKQYIDDSELMLQIQQIWIQMIYSFLSNTVINDSNIPSIHEALAILRFVHKFTLSSSTSLFVNNDFQMIELESIKNDQLDSQWIVQESTNDDPNRIARPQRTSICSNTENNQMALCTKDLCIPLLNMLLGTEWKSLLKLLFSSTARFWDTAQPRELIELFHVGWKIGLLNYINFQCFTQRLFQMQHLLFDNRRKRYDTLKELTTSSIRLSNLECRNLLLLLAMIDSSFNSKQSLIKKSIFLKHLAQSIVFTIPARISMSNLILFTTAVVQLRINLPPLRQRIIEEMQKGINTRNHLIQLLGIDQIFHIQICYLTVLSVSSGRETLRIVSFSFFNHIITLSFF